MLAAVKALAWWLPVLGVLLAGAGDARGAAPLLYVTNQDEGTVLVIDTASDAKMATLQVAPGPAMIAASPGGRHLYITHPESGQISILPGQAIGRPRIVEVSGEPFGIAVSAD